ncbi:MAG TPA: hypothetical protein PLC98_05315, partial [Anaerolineales bacterium]|nr:hypothetical protein [Anaerolineales bacterium]
EPVSVGLNAPALFTALCRDSIGAEHGLLLAEGPLAPLAGAPLQYPPSTAQSPLIDRPRLYHLLARAGHLGASLDPGEWHGLQWAVQLWSERGPIGVMLLGRKQDGGLYAQEDIEVARAGGERLLEAVINTELANRLITLQRRRLSEGQVLDQRLRRELHDEVLPQLHATMLMLGDATAVPLALNELAALHHRLSDLVRAMPNSGAPELRRHGLPGALRAVIEGELAGAFTNASVDVEPSVAAAAQALPAFAAETLYFAAREALRNAARHGRGGDPQRQLQISLQGHVECTTAGARLLHFGIRDDGVGVSPGGVTAGTQHGLTLHTTLMAVAGGGLEIASRPGGGTLVELRMPIPDAGNSASISG